MESTHISPAHRLPTELCWEIFRHLQLCDLIAARGVHSSWRTLVAFAPIHPARRRLLSFYDRAINSPAFLRTRPDIISHIQPFDRQAWLEKELARFSLPEDFKLWILEWPALAVTSWLWPGLPVAINCIFNDWTALSQNMLSGYATCIQKFTFEKAQAFVEWEAGKDAEGKTERMRQAMIECECLELRYHGSGWITLLVLAGSESLRGTIHLAGTGTVLVDSEVQNAVRGSTGWIEYLHKELDRIEDVFGTL